MSWTAPRTWVAAEVVTAALMNTHVRDNEKSLVHPIYHDTASVSLSSSTSPTSLFTAAPTIAAGEMGTNGVLYLTVWGSYREGSAATCALALTYGGSNLFSTADLVLPTSSTLYRFDFAVHNRSSASSQITFMDWIANTAPTAPTQNATSSIDTSASGVLDLKVTFSVSSGTNTFDAQVKIVQIGQT